MLRLDHLKYRSNYEIKQNHNRQTEIFTFYSLSMALSLSYVESPRLCQRIMTYLKPTKGKKNHPEEFLRWWWRWKRRLSIYVICAQRRLYLLLLAVPDSMILHNKSIWFEERNYMAHDNTIDNVKSDTFHCKGASRTHRKSHKAIIILMAMMRAGE